MTLLRTAGHECRECPYRFFWESWGKQGYTCSHSGGKALDYPAQLIHPDCPLPIGVEQKPDTMLMPHHVPALARSAETSQAIEEDDSYDHVGDVEKFGKEVG